MPILALPKGMAANSLQSNPWNPSQFIVSAATNFGITGGGAVFLISTPPLPLPSAPGGGPVPASGPAHIIGSVSVPGTGVLDAAISEVNGSLAIAGCADGSLVVCMFPPPAAGGGGGTIVGRVQGAHRSDVASLAWNPSRSSLFATGSWDRGVRVFDVERVGAAANTGGSMGGNAATSLASSQFGGPIGGIHHGLNNNNRPPGGGQPPLPPPSLEELQRGGHSGEVYEVSWCPKQPHLLASVGGDGGLKIWDMRVVGSPSTQLPSLPPQAIMQGGGNMVGQQQSGGSSSKPVLCIDAAHGGGGGGGGGPPRRNKVMSVSWNFYEPFICATGGTDNTAKIWDLRKVSPSPPASAMMMPNNNNPSSQPLVLLHSGHQAPVRRVRFSPHHRTCLLTGGYDYRVCMWNMNNNQGGGGPSNTHLQYRHDHHREFVTDVEWCMDPRAPLSVGSCSWDGNVAFWKLGGQLTP